MFSVARRAQASCCAIVLAASTAAYAGQDARLPPDTAITLERTRCFGECPAYTVSVDARGNITYVGKDLVRVVGEASARIDVARVSELLERASQIGFFDLRDDYKADITDLPTTIVTIASGGRSKRIVDYVSAPRELRAFERAIDEILRTRRWVRIDTQTLRQLLDTGWSPSRTERAELLRRALRNDDVDVVKALLDSGADPNAQYFQDKMTPLMMVRSAAATRLLLDAGANPLAVSDLGQTPLRSAALEAPGVTEVLLKAGTPLNVINDAMWHAACDGNSGVVALLLQARADVNATQNDVTPAGCARSAKAARAAYPPLPMPDDDWPFIPDFDGVVALLEKARSR